MGACDGFCNILGTISLYFASLISPSCFVMRSHHDVLICYKPEAMELIRPGLELLSVMDLVVL